MPGLEAGVRLDKRNLDRITAQLLPRARRIVREAAEAGATGAARRAPKKTGRLARSYRAEMNRADPNALSYSVVSDVEYASYVELGTSRMAAQPHLTPAMEDVRRTFGARVAALFRV